jgi:hypothetical protein
MKIFLVHNHSWNECLHQMYMLLLLLLLRPLPINHFLVTFVCLFDKHSSTTILLTVHNSFASYAKQHNPATFPKIVPSAQLQLSPANMINWRVFNSMKDIMLWLVLFICVCLFLFLFCQITDTCTIHVDYYSYWLIHMHRPFICAQTTSLQYKYLQLWLCIL